MSLLIKALDNAEKNKQAEKSKKQAAERIVETSLSLELAPIESRSIAQSNQPAESPIAQPAEKLPKQSIESPEVSPITDAPIDGGLSLEEEAGLNTSPMTVKKYAKAKPENNTANDQTNALKGNLESAQETTKPKVVSAVPVSTAPIFQPRPAATEANQKAAAKVFVANQAAKTPSSKYALVLLGVAGALMIWLGLQGYGYIKTLLAPDVVVVKPAMPLPQVAVAAETQDTSATPPSEEMPIASNEGTPGTDEVVAASNQNISTQTVDQSTTTEVKEVTPRVEVQSSRNMVVAGNEPPKTTRNRKAGNNNNDDAAQTDSESSVKREPLKLTSKVASSGVDPTLLAAYQAFNRGEYALAQQQYRQVLQRDVRNIDALLGMAAIAQRQGRDADAAGWFQKVLEIEPRNATAQSAMMNTQNSTDIVGTESRIKSMLAQQPEGANLHAALGNLYAEQNRWALAQEAYFNASRFAPNNADYAFNLAISLDQLGKSNLALKQYQRALDLLNQSGASSPDRVLLEARIQALQ